MPQRLIADYEAAHVDADESTRDILHLRARLTNRLAEEVPVTDVRAEMQEGLDSFRRWELGHAPPADGWTVAGVQRELDRLGELGEIARHLDRTLCDFLEEQERIERLHRQVIAAAKSRADSRLKNRRAREVTAFATFLQRIMRILRKYMPADDFARLEGRIERDFVDVPEVRSSLWTSSGE